MMTAGGFTDNINNKMLKKKKEKKRKKYIYFTINVRENIILKKGWLYIS